MTTIYQKIPARILNPGASFVFRPARHTQPCTILQTDNQTPSITYVEPGQEEPATIEGEAINETVYLVKDKAYFRKQADFRTSLSGQLKDLFDHMGKAPLRSMWGEQIQGLITSPDLDQFQQLVSELSSQAKDNPDAMARMVGRPLTILLLGHVSKP